MSMAIGNIVYGIRCTHEMRLKAIDLGMVAPGWNRDGWEALGFTTEYSASGDLPIWCGAKLGEIDESGDVPIKEIPREPTDAQRAEALAAIANLPEDLREMAAEPETWLIWGSS